MEDFDRIVTVAKTPEAASLAGALIALKWVPGNDMKERVANLAGGLSCAWFVTPIIVEFLLRNASANARAGLSFVIGLFGLSIASAVVQAIREVKLSEIIDSWLRKTPK